MGAADHAGPYATSGGVAAVKTVQYVDLCLPLRLGYPARVLCLDHPSPLVYSRRWAMTSPVQAVLWQAFEGPEFWTLHTHYVPVKNSEALT